MNKHDRLRSSLLVLMCLTLLLAGWLALHWQQHWLLSNQPALTLSSPQIQRLQTIDSEVVIEAYTRRNPKLQRALEQAINPLRAYVDNIHLTWLNPDTNPLKVQARGISQEGQLYIQLQDKGQLLEIVAPNLVAQALLNLSEQHNSIVIFTQGSGERAILSDLPGAWQRFYAHFKQAGLPIVPLVASQSNAVPDNTDLLIIANPTQWNDVINQQLASYLSKGGNLIYTTDTNNPFIPNALSSLSIAPLPGVMVDMNAKNFGLDNPQMLVIDTLGDHVITRGMDKSPLLASTVALKLNQQSDTWQSDVLLWSSPNSWNETGSIVGNIALDGGEIRGPLPLALLLSRQINTQQQSILILGDSDLWSDTYFSVGGNTQFAEEVMAYFTPQAPVARVAPPELTDQFVSVRGNQLTWLAVILLLLLPLSILGAGIIYWRQPCA